jgi:hypothetical protein
MTTGIANENLFNYYFLKEIIYVCPVIIYDSPHVIDQL